MTKTELPILVNGQAGSRAREEYDMQAIDVKGTVIGPLRLSIELLAWPLSCYRQTPIGGSEEIRLHRLDQVFGETSNYTV